MPIASLRKKIVEATAAGRMLRAAIGAASGLDRHALWNEKRAQGRRARILLLAYAYLRCRPYT